MMLRRSFITFAILSFLSGLAIAQSQEQTDRMARIIQFDDIAQVKRLLQDGISPNLLVRGGNPISVYAVRENSRTTLDYLLTLKNLDVDH